MARNRVLSEDEATEINLSPMIDCIFILLIFFIVTTVFVEEQGLQVNKPDAAATTSTQDDEKVVVEITPQNQILVDGRETSLADVAARVREGVRDSETPVVIRAHEKSSHATFVGAWDAAKLGGAVTLSFSTVN